ncbi:hypothetical protein L0F63_000941 [Massospora cicadina]|nr:hypothetical protein L0F63_000941 [Massospora cicadina]
MGEFSKRPSRRGFVTRQSVSTTSRSYVGVFNRGLRIRLRVYCFEDLTKPSLEVSRDVSFSAVFEGGDLPSPSACELQALEDAFNHPTPTMARDSVCITPSAEGETSPDLTSVGESVRLPLSYTLNFIDPMAENRPAGYGHTFFLTVAKGLLVTRLFPSASPNAEPVPEACGSTMRPERLTFRQLTHRFGPREKATPHADDLMGEFLVSLREVFGKTLGRVVSCLFHLQFSRGLIKADGPRNLVPITLGLELKISDELRSVMVSLELMHLLLVSIYRGETLDRAFEPRQDATWDRMRCRKILRDVVGSVEFFNSRFPFLLREVAPTLRFDQEVWLFEEPLALKPLVFGDEPSDLKLLLYERGSQCTVFLHREIVQPIPFFSRATLAEFGWEATTLALECENFTSLAVLITIQYVYSHRLPALSLKANLDVFRAADFFRPGQPCLPVRVEGV